MAIVTTSPEANRFEGQDTHTRITRITFQNTATPRRPLHAEINDRGFLTMWTGTDRLDNTMIGLNPSDAQRLARLIGGVR